MTEAELAVAILSGWKVCRVCGRAHHEQEIFLFTEPIGNLCRTCLILPGENPNCRFCQKSRGTND